MEENDKNNNQEESRDDRRRSRADETLAFRIEATPDGRPNRVDGPARSGSQNNLKLHYSEELCQIFASLILSGK